VAISRIKAEEAVREVEWPTLVFFMGLFIMVGALIEVGIIEQLAAAAVEATGGKLLLTSMLLLWVSALLSALVDNIPYVATMSPIVSQLVGNIQTEGNPNVLWWALALGADLGGNATAIGASANVVVLGVAERSGHPISFWTFTRYGFGVAVITIALAMPYLYLRYFVFA
jgi:Na+/H+ antiporter NhaD/arsenite permease-like protein